MLEEEIASIEELAEMEPDGRCACFSSVFVVAF